MSRVIFMCGPAGSEKSTYAKRFETEGMVRLSFDVEAAVEEHRKTGAGDDLSEPASW